MFVTNFGFYLLTKLNYFKNVFKYNNCWFNNIEEYSETQFIDDFRMPRATFDNLFALFTEEFNIKDLKRKLYVMIYYLAHVNTFRSLRNTTGLPKTTLNRWVNEMSGVFTELCEKYIKMPQTREELIELKNGLMGENSPHNFVLAIDGTHVKIQVSGNSYKRPFINRKSTYSVNYLAIVDYKRRFRGISYNCGSFHDSRVLRLSGFDSLFSTYEEFKVIGDSPYSSSPNLITTRISVTNPQPRAFMKLLSGARMVVEMAFGDLKNRFKRLKYPIVNGDTNNVIRIVLSCMFLHNFIIDNVQEENTEIE